MRLYEHINNESTISITDLKEDGALCYLICSMAIEFSPQIAD